MLGAAVDASAPERSTRSEATRLVSPVQSLRTATRFVLAVVLGTLAAVLSHHFATIPDPQRDFTQLWFSARALRAGLDPYVLIGPGLTYDWSYPLLYPLTAAVSALPLAALSAPLANAVFTFVGATAFAWALSRHGYGALIGFFSASMFVAVQIVQWAPLFAGAMFIAPLGIFLAAKPTIGAAVFVARPSWWAIYGGIALVVIATLMLPTWPLEWLDAFRRNAVLNPITAPHSPPVALPGGFLVLACLTRWRRPEARLVAALACVPQTLMPYETVPLFLVPTAWQDALLLTALSWGAVTWVMMHVPSTDFARFVTACAPVMVWALYLPATIMILRRPNVGPLPSWLEPRIPTHWPAWLKGANA